MSGEQTVESVCAAIERFEAAEWPDGPMRENARRFRPEAFRLGLAEAVLASVEERTGAADTLIGR